MLTPHPYMLQIRDYFKAQQKTWAFFAAQTAKEKEWADFKTSLLKNAYRMSADAETDLHTRLENVKAKLEINIPVTLYQLQNSSDINAFISFQQSEAHLVFCGPILKLLQEDELDALLAHELSHVKLYSIDGGDYQIMNSLITAIANDARSEEVFLETARYFRLYMEIFCDRGALLATGSEALTQSSLIKIHTGLEKVSAANYLQQAKEILQNEKELKSENETHPENFLRVLAVHLYATTPETADAEIAKLIEERFDMDKLDIFRQQKLAHHTKFILNEFTSPKWIQTDAVMSVCAQYFQELKKQNVEAIEWHHELFNQNVREYFSYVMMDVAMADSQLENLPLGRAFQFSELYGFKEEFGNVLKKEQKLSDKRFRELQNRALEAVSKIAD